MSGREKLAVLPKLTPTWDKALSESVTIFIQRLRDIINGGIAEGVHTASTFVEYAFRAPTSAPVSVLSPYPYKPTSVEMLEFWQTSGTPAPISIAGSFEWEWGDGQILIPQLSGLTGNESYRIVLLVRGG